VSKFIRTYAKLTLRKRIKEIMGSVARILPEEYEQNGPGAEEWYYPFIGSQDPRPIAGDRRRMFFLEVRVNVFSRFARDRADGDTVALDRLSDLVQSGLSKFSADILDLDSAAPHNIQGNVRLDEGRIDPIPENPRTPGIIGLSCVFFARVVNSGPSR